MALSVDLAASSRSANNACHRLDLSANNAGRSFVIHKIFGAKDYNSDDFDVSSGDNMCITRRSLCRYARWIEIKVSPSSR
ncbi:hypothetical protein [Asanoa siamensis]|uniref:hypothetical protein n=1 Tax=Asanoa siamensis TaxID=926357 RepID=UPI00194276CF|nr:hypothetical protein [Asanoa siamensis]